MHDPISHLAGIEAGEVNTQRLKMFVLTRGPQRGEPVIFLHGNLCSSTIWEETMLSLPEGYRAVAPDQRGYGLTDRDAYVDASGGVAQWAEDALALADALDWDQFHVVGHSLGGGVVWALLALAAERLLSATLVAPGPPCGFGGTVGEQGELIHPDGAGSGAGLANQQLIDGLVRGEREIVDPLFSPLAAMHRLLWKTPFSPDREEELLTAMLQVHLGENRFPGDRLRSPHWPGFAPGSHGPINALAPLHNQWLLPRLLQSRHKPRLLWIYGEDDRIVRDGSPSDAGMQGKLGLREGWPGEEVFPPQPLLTQVLYALDQYAHSGGAVERLRLPNVGHSPMLESPHQFQTALAIHLKGN